MAGRSDSSFSSAPSWIVKRASSRAMVMGATLAWGTDISGASPVGCDVVLWAWLIRHGESESNAGTPSAEPGASPLTARGREQAAGLAATLPEPPTLIVASPYRRAAQTAEPTAARFPDV